MLWLRFSQCRKWDIFSNLIKLNYICTDPLRQGQNLEKNLHTDLLFWHQCIFGKDLPTLIRE